MTTLNSRDIFHQLRQMKDAGVEHVVLEVTSHALDQNRLAGVRFDGGIILNLFREHLDYHGDMESYAKAKGLMIGHIKEGASLIVNKDNKWTKGIVDKAQDQGRKLNVVWLKSKDVESIETGLMGEWNKENVLAVYLLAKEIGIDKENIERGVASVDSIPGRMEWVSLKSKIQNPNDKSRQRARLALKGGKPNSQLSNSRLPRVLIDYAVTPDALERVYKEVRGQTKGKIFAVLGACGNRDRGKRAEMANVVAGLADELVLTREDPWTESEEQIFKDLEGGLSNIQFKWKRIDDRREAIRYCLERGGVDDVVVVTGKGAEVGMAIGDKVIPWSEREVIQEELQKLVTKSPQ